MDEQALNKKLAEWVGFRWEHLTCSKHSPELCHWAWVMPDGVEASRDYDLPNFIQSLDACFTWLMPKVDSWRVVIYQNAAGGYTSYVDSKCKCRMWEETLSFAETPALALCLAIEKMIDGGQ